MNKHLYTPYRESAIETFKEFVGIPKPDVDEYEEKEEEECSDSK